MHGQQGNGEMVEAVRTELMRIRQRDGLTYDALASRIKKPSGERYHPKTVAQFVQGANPARDWRPFALDAARGWRIGRLKFSPKK